MVGSTQGMAFQTAPRAPDWWTDRQQKLLTRLREYIDSPSTIKGWYKNMSCPMCIGDQGVDLSTIQPPWPYLRVSLVHNNHVNNWCKICLLLVPFFIYEMLLSSFHRGSMLDLVCFHTGGRILGLVYSQGFNLGASYFSLSGVILNMDSLWLTVAFGRMQALADIISTSVLFHNLAVELILILFQERAQWLLNFSWTTVWKVFTSCQPTP